MQRVEKKLQLLFYFRFKNRENVLRLVFFCETRESRLKIMKNETLGDACFLN